MSRTLIFLGIVLLVAGVLWPWLTRLGLGRLPGDIVVERDDFTFYLPITTGIFVGVVASLIVWRSSSGRRWVRPRLGAARTDPC